MIRTLRRITAPTLEPIDLELAKSHARIDTDQDDAYIRDILIPAAREQIESDTGYASTTQTWRLTLDAFPGDSLAPIDLAHPPFGSVSSFGYVDSDGNAQTLTLTTDFITDGEHIPPRVRPAVGTVWPSTQTDIFAAVTIDWTAGVSDPADIPADHRLAMLELISHWYENRESVLVTQGGTALPIPDTVARLTQRVRVWNF